MKFSDLNGKMFRIISAAPWEILLEEESSMGMCGQKYTIKPDDTTNEAGFGSSLELVRLKEETVQHG